MEKISLKTRDIVLVTGKKEKKVHPFRNTQSVRASQKILKEILSYKIKEDGTLSKMVDTALAEYLLFLKRRCDN